MSNGEAASPGPNRRQLLGLLGAGSLTALSAAIVATSSALDDDELEDDEEDGDDPPDDGDEAEGEESMDLFSIDWDTRYGNDRAGTFTAVNREDGGLELGGVQLDEDDAGVGWLVDGADPESETTAHTYVSELNLSRQDVDEGYAVHDSIELVLPVDDGRLLVGWTHDISPDSKTAWVRRVDGDGAEEWDAEYTRPEVNSFRDVFLDGVATDDDGAVLAGVTLGSEFVDTRHGDGWLAKIAADGEREWEQTYNTADTTHTDWTEDDRHDRLTTITRVEEGYLLAGTTTLGEDSSVAPSEPWILAVDEEGEKRWEVYDDRELDEDSDRQNRVIEDLALNGADVLAAGTVGSYEYARPFRTNVLTGDGWLGYLQDGSFDWQQRIEGASIRTVDHIGEGYYVLGGQRDDSAWLGIIDSDGELIDQKRLHDADGVVLATTYEEDELVVAGRRSDGTIPVGFATGVSIEVPDA
ncbi:hypothetical protein [Natranaeroarchaeum sulfidigenes]|uniref:Cell surface protein n=1 Tax=Natranaeroarchaeum sulfidigenes TaxID=2784880 RepID=A0A897MWP6_9EURY|nr:hypothetical protein [Natranaeroarchaeum sulfidigenes]QSG02735.1 Cell surface protein [Natranaeroarchaeum sulfidigenes]